MNHSARQLLSLLSLGSTIAVVVAGCSPKIKSAALGKWRVEGSSETMEFRNDGTCQGNDRDGRVVRGKFAFVDADHVKIELTMSSEDKAKEIRFVEHSAGVVKMVVNGDELSMTDENGSAMHYQRLR